MMDVSFVKAVRQDPIKLDSQHLCLVMLDVPLAQWDGSKNRIKRASTMRKMQGLVGILLVLRARRAQRTCIVQVMILACRMELHLVMPRHACRSVPIPTAAQQIPHNASVEP
jgi:hypothetical protein